MNRTSLCISVKLHLQLLKVKGKEERGGGVGRRRGFSRPKMGGSILSLSILRALMN